LLLIALVLNVSPALSAKRALTLDDLHRVQDVSQPQFAPRGDAIV
jgi:hypothetical protein